MSEVLWIQDGDRYWFYDPAAHEEQEVTQKEERNWKRISDLEVEVSRLTLEVGKIKVELVDMDHRLMIVEGMLKQSEVLLLELGTRQGGEEGRKRMVGQGGESKNAVAGKKTWLDWFRK